MNAGLGLQFWDLRVNELLFYFGDLSLVDGVEQEGPSTQWTDSDDELYKIVKCGRSERPNVWMKFRPGGLILTTAVVNLT